MIFLRVVRTSTVQCTSIYYIFFFFQEFFRVFEILYFVGCVLTFLSLPRKISFWQNHIQRTLLFIIIIIFAVHWFCTTNRLFWFFFSSVWINVERVCFIQHFSIHTASPVSSTSYLFLCTCLILIKLFFPTFALAIHYYTFYTARMDFKCSEYMD